MGGQPWVSYRAGLLDRKSQNNLPIAVCACRSEGSGYFRQDSFEEPADGNTVLQVVFVLGVLNAQWIAGELNPDLPLAKRMSSR